MLYNDKKTTMKIIVLIIFFLFCSKLSYEQSVYSFSITTAEGQQHSLQEYGGKNILILVLPVTQTGNDSLYLKWVDSVAAAHAEDLQVIGVPSYEDGYTNNMAAALNTFYRQFLNARLLISSGLNTHKTSVTQHALFAWLTNSSQNIHYDKDVAGTGQMFFITGQGTLHGVFGPECKFSNKVLTYMLH